MNTKQSKKKRVKPIEPRYSGDRSLGFWRKVNSVPTRIENREAYALGVALQEAESAILRPKSTPQFVRVITGRLREN